MTLKEVWNSQPKSPSGLAPRAKDRNTGEIFCLYGQSGGGFYGKFITGQDESWTYLSMFTSTLDGSEDIWESV